MKTEIRNYLISVEFIIYIELAITLQERDHKLSADFHMRRFNCLITHINFISPTESKPKEILSVVKEVNIIKPKIYIQ